MTDLHVPLFKVLSVPSLSFSFNLTIYTGHSLSVSSHNQIEKYNQV